MSNTLPAFAEDFASPHYYPNLVPIDDEPLTPIARRFEIPGLVDQMRSSPNTLFVDPSVSKTLGLDSYMLRSTSFVPRPDWSLGRENSVQEVFFGQLDLTVDKGLDGETTSLPVAVKPYHSSTWEAVHEYIGFQLVNGTGSIESFHPIGLWVDNDQRTFLLTSFEEDVVSLDNIEWQNYEHESLSDDFEPFNALAVSATILALLHKQGFIHGDAQVRNMARNKRGFRITDLTKLRRVMSETAIDEPGIRSKMTKDLADLTRSVSEDESLQRLSRKRRRQVIQENLIAPYLNVMRRKAAEVSFIGPVATADVVDITSITETILEAI